MKVNPKFLIMMSALAAGTALAAPPAAVSAGTTAGTVITNTASASYTDPATPANTLTSTSNTVSTKVTPITGFDITYQDGSADGTTATTPAATYDIPDAVPGGKVLTTYTVLNNSNIDGYVVNFEPDTTNSAVALPVGNVVYYPTGTTLAQLNSATPPTAITSVTLTNGGTGAQKNIVQVITIPTAATPSQKYSASPKGTAPASSNTTAYPTAPAAGTFLVYLEETNNTTTGDLEYTRATVSLPVLNVLPPTSPNGTPPASPTAPTTPGPTPPSGTTPPLTYTPPVPPTPVPGTTTNPGTVIGITGDNQDAYPKADANTNADVVTFFSKVENKGTLPDTIYVKPTVPTGATSVTVLDKDGNVLTAEATGPNAGQFKLPGGTVAVNGTVEYRIVVTYPDSDSKATQADIAVPVSIYSGNVPTATPKVSTFTIHPPQMAFGDSDSVTTTANPGLEAIQEVKPNGVIPTALTAAVLTDKTDAVAVFPMDVVNNGTY